MGVTSDGKMPWYDVTKVFDIFKYCAQCNAAALAGYSDWRVPNQNEYGSLFIQEQPNGHPDSTAFPGWFNSDYFWSSTTLPYYTTYAMFVLFNDGGVYTSDKTTTYFVSLVRLV
jgi:hypothetical protein